MSKYLIYGGTACVLMGWLVGVGHPAAGQDLHFSYLSALPPRCKGGCSLEMITPTVGWLRGRNGLWATTNGGVSWHERDLPRTIGTGNYATIQFVDERRVWVLAVPPKLYGTADGGASWAPLPLPEFDGIIHAAWSLPDTGLTWVGGGVYRPSKSPDAPNYALKTYETGGWGVLHPAVFVRQGTGIWDHQELPGCSWQVEQVRFWDERLGFAVGDGCFYFSDSGGRTWTPGTFSVGSRSVPGYPGEAGRPTVFFVDRANGWLGLDDGSLYRTSDGGKYWLRIGSSDVPRFSALYFWDQVHGLGIGSGSRLYETLDAGATWKVVKTDFRPRGLSSLGGRSSWVLSDDTLFKLSFD